MNRCQRATRSVLIGLAISLLALVLDWLGHWGSPGSANPLAILGGILGYWQTTLLCALIPPIGEFLATGLEHPWERMAATFAVLVAVPTLTWSTVIFAVWSLRARRGRGHAGFVSQR